MKYPFRVFQTNVNQHTFWVAQSQSLKGCVGQGETPDEAINELAQNEEEWLNTAIECGIVIPDVPHESLQREFSGKLTVRIAPAIHEMAAQMAKREGVSLTQYISDAIVNWNAQNSCLNYVSDKVRNMTESINGRFLSGNTMSIGKRIVSLLDYHQPYYSLNH